jgi:hypothetical protein
VAAVARAVVTWHLRGTGIGAGPAGGGREPLARGSTWKGRKRARPKKNSASFDLFDFFQKGLNWFD